MYITSIHWSFFSTCTSLQYIEAFWEHVPHFTLLKLLKYMLITSLYWIFFNTGFSLNLILLSTCTLVHWIESYIYYIYYSSVYLTILNTCKSLRFIDAFWKSLIWFSISNHVMYKYFITVWKVIEYMYVASMNWSFLSNESHFTKLKLF